MCPDRLNLRCRRGCCQLLLVDRCDSLPNRRHFLNGGAAAIIAGAAPRSAWAATQADVIIIGAGLSGLMAARTLEAAGLKIIMIEGEDRIGGRLFTLDDVPGKPDAGGIQVGSGYTRLRALATALGVGVIEGPVVGAGAADARRALLHINGLTVAEKDWPTSPANRLAPDEKAISPLSLATRFSAAIPRLDKPEAWLDAPQAHDISYESALRHGGASAEALRLIGANMNGNSLAGLSQVNVARAAALFRASPGPAATIAGGSQRLPAAMAAQIKGPIRLNQIVTAIEEHGGGVTVTTRHGQIFARHVICTIPFSALRHITIRSRSIAGFTGLIPVLSYTRASFAYLSAREAFWKTDGLPETLWSDDPLIGRVFVLGDDPPMLKTWAIGAGADVIDRMSAEGAASAIISRIERARPSSRGMLKVERLFSWQKSPMARGLYHHIGTGQAAMLARAVMANGMRLHFAGEHLARGASGMEAALASGEAVASGVATRI
jgi:monoamine oxidase